MRDRRERMFPKTPLHPMRSWGTLPALLWHRTTGPPDHMMERGCPWLPNLCLSDTVTIRPMTGS